MFLDDLNRDIGTDFDTVSDVVSYVERLRAMHTASTSGGEA